MYYIFFIICFLASIVGSICGIGGGIIIKPVLDTVGLFDVGSISFLSGCTVLAMSAISIYHHLKVDFHSINLKLTTPLAFGAAAGGILGKYLFQFVYVVLPNYNMVGAIQASVLLLITLASLIYTINAKRIKTLQLHKTPFIFLVGLILGLLSSFLGIGGGPINLVLLNYFFSIDPKKAASNSLYIIMISQLASLISTIILNKVPEIDIVTIIFMVIGGLLGGILGSKLHQKISSKNAQHLFIGLMIIIIGINLANIYKFMSIH